MSKKILIVDDSRVARTLTKRLIEEIAPGIESKEAQTGDEAITLAADTTFDAIFMDMNMPGTDGLTAAGRILAARPSQKIALVTANIQDAVRDRAQAMGLRFIGKPAQKSEIESFLKA